MIRNPAAPKLLHILLLPDCDRADAIGGYWGNPATRTFAELLIDCEEGRTLRAVLGMLEEAMAYSWMTESAGRGVVIGSA